jgi:endonuclease/exonuclease/phosphatase family metal-dependent hydrolase
MTYNIQAGGGNLAGIAEVIRSSGATLVALQEVDVHWDQRSGFANQAAELAKTLGLQVRFAPIYRLPGADAASPPREYGVALLSRYPIVAFTNHAITRLSTQGNTASPTQMPGFLEVTIDVGGRRVRVFNTHLDYRSDPAVRRQQVSESLAIIGAYGTPMLMFGDLNAVPTAPELQPLFRRLRDGWPESAGTGFTYPAVKPVRRIDYVLASDHFRVIYARVPDAEASDHRPVVIDVVIK